MTPGRFVALERMTIERLTRASPMIDPGIPRMNAELAWIRPPGPNRRISNWRGAVSGGFTNPLPLQEGQISVAAY